ncbi:MAG: D-aminoacyl-tRNA deacylase [Candidatus Omnitrophica bacterium]|nr:D-aminoacyl-tRNA deacylase [Candidatus Omnitrophota bacterium]MDD5430344.1 D-aminoacyl-tRNA deacylase [Candidatus Omnitrophota bacterium]
MKLVALRVKQGSIYVAGEKVSSISKGMALFVGFESGDCKDDITLMAQRAVNLRIFENQEGKLDYSVKDKELSILCIPNFTLCASTDKGRRPSFEESMPYSEAEGFFDEFVLALKAYGIDVQEGVFGAYMDINLDLDGPVNIIIESKEQDS